MLLVLPAGHARHSFGNHLHNGGAFFRREIENGKFLLHTVPKVDAMRGLFVCDVSFSDAAKIGDVPLCRFAIDAHILDENCTPMYLTALAPACILVEFSRLPSNIHCEGHWGMCAVGILKSDPSGSYRISYRRISHIRPSTKAIASTAIMAINSNAFRIIGASPMSRPVTGTISFRWKLLTNG